MGILYGTIYSAEVAEATANKERRIKITNRKTGDKYYRPYPTRSGTTPDRGEALKAKVYDIHTSPLFAPTILWYDEALDMLFFEINRRS
jgi:hypothetical protein